MIEQKAVIVIPTLDEAIYIGPILHGLLDQPNCPPIWVVDGGSRDSTRSIVLVIGVKHPTLSLLHNPGRSQAAAINLAAKRAFAEGFTTLIRLDAHAAYPQGFVAGLLGALNTSGADSIVVPLFARGTSPWQAAAADLQNSWLGNGGAPHRTGRVAGWVDHGHHAAFRLNRFVALHGYDPRFAANEDAEFDARLITDGGRIFLASSLAVTYFPRKTPGALARQMVRNGWFRVMTALKNNQVLGIRQQAPTLASLLVLLSLMLGLAHPVALLPAFGYGALVLILASLASSTANPVHILRIALLASVSHGAFACGVLGSLAQHLVVARSAGRSLRTVSPWRR